MFPLPSRAQLRHRRAPRLQSLAAARRRDRVVRALGATRRRRRPRLGPRPAHAAALSATTSRAACASPSRIRRIASAFSLRPVPPAIAPRALRARAREKSSGAIDPLAHLAPPRPRSRASAPTNRPRRAACSRTTHARRTPSDASARAAIGLSASSYTPTSWCVARAGFASGPSALKIVRTPSSRRATAACRSAGWCAGAKRNAIRASRKIPAWSGGGISTGIPSASVTSALPHRLEIDRFPCFATATPHAATTIAAAVDRFSVCPPSPPVPHVSSTTSSPWSTTSIASRIASAAGDDHVRPLALHAQRDREGPHLHRRPRPREDRLERSTHERRRRRARPERARSPPRKRRGRRATSHAAPPPRALRAQLRVRRTQFARSFFPSSVSTLSGWDCTPSDVEALVAEPHDFPLGRPRRHLQAGGERRALDEERVVPRGLERRGERREEARRPRGGSARSCRA